MAVYNYDHIHLRTPDPAETAQFYNKMFDARIIETPQAGGNTRIDFDLNGLTIFLAGAMAPGAEVQGLTEPHYGLDHFGLRVDDLDSAVAELKSRGAEFLSEPRTLPTRVKIVFIKAPDDVRIELLERH